MSSLEGDVANVAKQNGGDAVIVVRSEAETVGTVGSTFGQAQGNAFRNGNSTTMNATGSSTSIAHNVQKQQSKYAVVQYVERKTEVGKPAENPVPVPAPVPVD